MVRRLFVTGGVTQGNSRRLSLNCAVLRQKILARRKDRERLGTAFRRMLPSRSPNTHARGICSNRSRSGTV
jgi:hypothetical protein